MGTAARKIFDEIKEFWSSMRGIILTCIGAFAAAYCAKAWFSDRIATLLAFVVFLTAFEIIILILARAREFTNIISEIVHPPETTAQKTAALEDSAYKRARLLQKTLVTIFSIMSGTLSFLDAHNASYSQRVTFDDLLPNRHPMEILGSNAQLAWQHWGYPVLVGLFFTLLGGVVVYGITKLCSIFWLFLLDRLNEISQAARGEAKPQ